MYSCMENIHPGTDHHMSVCPAESHLSFVSQLGLLFYPDEGGKVQNHEEVLEGSPGLFSKELIPHLSFSSSLPPFFLASLRPLATPSGQIGSVLVRKGGSLLIEPSTLTSRWPL